MGKIVKCPECGKTAEPMDGQVIWCTGKRTPDAIPHKLARRMT